ncbi:MAG: polymer-forming cytoskeletal protein [Proteobacteria bacterium]|nr:polymer-forming cytoskeletal protein [Pseudomonadota bacterium]
MFRRKKSVVAVPRIPIVPEADGGSMAKPAAKPSARQVTPLPVTNPVPARPFTASTGRRSDIPGMGRKRPDMDAYTGAESKTLVVGRDIFLNGNNILCDRLVVEGSVEAEKVESRIIEIYKDGHFKGTALIENAEISGWFEGKLKVSKRLVIHAGGRVIGNIRYGQLEVEVGGEISGDVKLIPPSEGQAEEPLPMEPLTAVKGKSRERQGARNASRA